MVRPKQLPKNNPSASSTLNHGQSNVCRSLDFSVTTPPSTLSTFSFMSSEFYDNNSVFSR